MIIEIKIPSPGESITEAQLATWLVNDGDYVEKDQELAEIESDKATLPLLAPDNGQIKIIAQAGNTVKIGAVACTIDTSVSKTGGNQQSEESSRQKTADSQHKTDDNTSEHSRQLADGIEQMKTEGQQQADSRQPLKNIRENAVVGNQQKGSETITQEKPHPEAKTEMLKEETLKISPVAQRMMEEENLSVEELVQGLKRIGKKDVEEVLKLRQVKTTEISRNEERKKMSPLRKKLSERLVAVKNQTAMLTTFNEADMSAIIEMRKKYQQQFEAKHGTKIGYMSFFAKAVVQALKLFPNVNSMIDGDEIVTPNYYDIAVAVQTDKGLMAPVLRNVESLSMAEIEYGIATLASKARAGRISMDEITGGTFTITNGGVFGSLLSTPIINPPQAAILGMHNIVERPVAIAGKVEIRPMMYIALSYDHRIIDGKDSVSFLVTVKQFLENPVKLLFEGGEPERELLEI